MENNPWCAPSWCIPKKDGRIRFFDGRSAILDFGQAFTLFFLGFSEGRTTRAMYHNSADHRVEGICIDTRDLVLGRAGNRIFPDSYFVVSLETYYR